MTRAYRAEPFIAPNFGARRGQPPSVRSAQDSLPAVTSHGAGGHVEPLLTAHYRSGGVCNVDGTAPTVTTKDRIAPIQPGVDGKALDIRFRMLEPQGFATVMGLPKEYEVTGNRTDVVRQIGNAVAVQAARWLCMALLGGNPNPAGQSTMTEAEATA